MSDNWEVIFDCETKKFFDEIESRNPGDLGVSVVSVYRRRLDGNLNELEGEMRSFFENEFEQMWPWFEGARRVIGFNSLGFDVPALEPYYAAEFGKLGHFDILEQIRRAFGRRVSLDAVAKETLGVENGKIASGADAVKWWRAGDRASLEKLKAYCEMDVAVTRDVYDFGLKNGLIKFKDRWNELREVEVDFTYPEKEEVEDKREEQLGLF